MMSLRKFLLLAIDWLSTILTLMTGLSENPLLVFITGRYDLIRSRFVLGKINYDIIRDDLLNVSHLADLVEVGRSYRFFTAPDRKPENLGEDRSTCTRVNSMNSSILTLNYDDFFGKGARREQIYLYSISAPHCQVVNFRFDWFDNCVRQQGNQANCHRYIFDNFDDLLDNRLLQVGVEQDFGTAGKPFLKCLGRPFRRFKYMTDLMVHQSYWAGGSFHVEVQSSECWAVPLIRNPDWKWGLFSVEGVDEKSMVVGGIEQESWVVSLISVVYGVVSITMIFRGLYIAFSAHNVVRYVPSAVRRKLFGLIPSPQMDLVAYYFPPQKKTAVVTCQDQRLMASELWMNHWLYILLSILEALSTLRRTYIVLEMGTWMLSKQINMDNFLFICTALTKLTWIMCFTHTVFRYAIKFLLHFARNLVWFQNTTFCDRVGWYVDSVAMFVSYKLYLVMLCIFLYSLLILNGSTTLIVHQAYYKQGVYGGYPDVANFWMNEIVCDLFVICSVLLAASHVMGAVLLMTKYRALTYNRLLRLVQDRFLFVGWDLVITMEALGMDPTNPYLVQNGVAMTNCSFAALLHQLYTSGPSGLVEFAGDNIFVDRVQDCGPVRYPPDDAELMGFKTRCLQQLPGPTLPGKSIEKTDQHHAKTVDEGPKLIDAGPHTSSVVVPLPAHLRPPEQRAETTDIQAIGDSAPASPNGDIRGPCAPPKELRFFDRPLDIYWEWRWGKLVLVDNKNSPGQLCESSHDGMPEFVVYDALMFLEPHEMQLMTERSGHIHCELQSLEWIELEATAAAAAAAAVDADAQAKRLETDAPLRITVSAAASAATATSTSTPAAPVTVVQREAPDVLEAHAQRMTKQNVLNLLTSSTIDATQWRAMRSDPATAAAAVANDRLWVFVVNEKYALPSIESLAGLEVRSSGQWRQASGCDKRLPPEVAAVLFRALSEMLVAKVTAHFDFLVDQDAVVPNDPKFIYRCPSLTQLNHFDVYLQEDFPVPAFHFHFQILPPHDLLCVNVRVLIHDRTRSGSTELGDSKYSWMRTLGLPTGSDLSVVDVWHSDDGLVSRIVTDHKYADVFPRFRSIARRKHKRDGDDGAGGDGDDAKKDDDDAADDDDDDQSAQDGGDNDDLMRRTPNSLKKKRKKSTTEPADIDESVVPVSPDTHVNSPEATGPIIRMTFPHDKDSSLLPDRVVHPFKRKRNPRKNGNSNALAVSFGPLNSSSAPTTSGSTGSAALTPTSKSPSLLDMSRNLSSALTPRGEVKPPSATVSVAVSLVASLSQNEQEEALDAKPSRAHPMLEALAIYVDKEMEQRSQGPTIPSMKQKTIINAAAFVPSDLSEGTLELSVNSATEEVLRRRLLGDKFAPWRIDYKPNISKKLQHRLERKERKRKLLMEFDEKKWREYDAVPIAPLRDNGLAIACRDLEISMGVRLAAKEALVGWTLIHQAILPTLSHAGASRIANRREKKMLTDRVKPYLQVLNSYLKRKAKSDKEISRTRTAWLSFMDYANGGKKGDGQLKLRELDATPKIRVATSEAAFQAEAFAVSEYLLRNLHPMSAPKPLDYVIVCPRSPSDWLGSLTLSYLTSLKSIYARCHMGDHATADLSSVLGNPSVAVDATNAALMVECATSSMDAFCCYRTAGEMLQPVLSQGVKKKQAFSRTAVATVVYLVAPFRRGDVRHKLWLLGAFGRGLFGEDLDAAPWHESVTLELLYLEDLFEVAINASPFQLLPQCFRLYDRVREKVVLKPVAPPTAGDAAGAQVRYVSERLYHLADWRSSGKHDPATSTAMTYCGYSVSDDGQWLWFTCVDGVGSLLESHVLVIAENVRGSLQTMLTQALSFAALSGEKTTLVITRSLDAAISNPTWPYELTIWRELFDAKDVTERFSSVVTRVMLSTATTIPTEAMQLRSNTESGLCYHDTEGFVLTSFAERGHWQQRSRITALASATGGIESLPERETSVIKFHVVEELPVGKDDGSSRSTRMRDVLTDFHALSFLTMHPVALERQSPFPLHLAVLHRLQQEHRMLLHQLQARDRPSFPITHLDWIFVSLGDFPSRSVPSATRAATTMGGPDSDDAAALASEHDDLLAFGSPRKAFSRAADDGARVQHTEELLTFYRARCDQFAAERQALVDQLASVEISKEQFHRTQWELKTTKAEVAELEDALKKSNAALFQTKADNIELQAENKTLRIQEEQDRKKIQHLLALTQPVTEEVTFFRDCRPDRTASYPIQPVTTTPARPVPRPRAYTYTNTVHIGSERMKTSTKKTDATETSATKTQSRPTKPRATVNRVLRTVYMPNEQTTALTRTIENLQEQLAAHQRLTDERIQSLLDGFAEEKAKISQQHKRTEEQKDMLERQLERTQRLLHQTTKDYLVLRHKSQEAERLAHEEVYSLKEQCEQLTKEKTQVTKQAQAETEAMKQIAKDEGNHCAQEFRNQALSRERDMLILKDQYAAVQAACARRIEDLQTRLTKLRGRYRSLEKRRNMEMEGFTRDIATLKRHLHKLELMLYGRRLTLQERKALRADEQYTLDSNELSEEIAALQQRFAELAKDMAATDEEAPNAPREQRRMPTRPIPLTMR
ncbi:TPA: hypothetical protein N0F65_002468 [Lagenidium giganteum]|uniref:MID domain-containing protein n=1 Tax=Lagenidium giganteum TaxID=4803 RepID=A0AAV2YND4_9STRA|nr:TPA: hypothetical protein N0F65_002468 [Lagenidium giganteum]